MNTVRIFIFCLFATIEAKDMNDEFAKGALWNKHGGKEDNRNEGNKNKKNCIPPSDISETLTRNAMNIWVTKTFGDYMKKYCLPSNSVNENNVKSFIDTTQTESISGIANQLEEWDATAIVNIWKEYSFITAEIQNEMIKTIKSDDMIKTVWEIVTQQKNNQFIYGIVGYTDLWDEQSSLFYAFSKFVFTSTVSVTFTPTDNCTVWGTICQYNYDIKRNGLPLKDYQTDSLINYMKQTTITFFTRENDNSFRYANVKAEQYQQFLPAIVKDKLKRLNENSDEVPDEVLTKNPLDLNC